MIYWRCLSFKLERKNRVYIDESGMNGSETNERAWGKKIDRFLNFNSFDFYFFESLDDVILNQEFLDSSLAIIDQIILNSRFS